MFTIVYVLREYHTRYLRAYQYQLSCKSESLVQHSPQQRALDRSVRALTRASCVGTLHAADNATDVMIETHMEAARKYVQFAQKYELVKGNHLLNDG
jgi:hypothetical protein